MTPVVTARSGSKYPFGVAIYTAKNGQRCAVAGEARGSSLGRVRGDTFRPYDASQAGTCRAANALFHDAIDIGDRTLLFGRAKPGARTVTFEGTTQPGRHGRRVPVRPRARPAQLPVRRGIARRRRGVLPDMRTIVLGGGICGLATALMLARDGHDVTVLERDGDPVPDSAEAAWERWQRHGVVQFRQAHYLQSRGRQVLDDELPDVTRALEAAGALRLDPISRMPPGIADRARRPGDERFVTFTGRRTTLERAVARIAEAELDVRRGVTVTASRPAACQDATAASGSPPISWSTPWAAARRCRSCSAAPGRGGRGLRLPLLHALLPRPLPEMRGAPLTALGTFSILSAARRRRHLVA